MGVPVLARRGLGMRFGCGMKMIKGRNSSPKFSLDVGGLDFLHFGPTAESASHHILCVKLSDLDTILSRRMSKNLKFMLRTMKEIIFPENIRFLV